MRRLLTRLGATLLCCSALAVAATSFGFIRFPSPATTAVTYYLSPSGNDQGPGTSPGTPWRTLGRASRATLRPGDQLLLRGGSQFAGTLRLGAADAGQPGLPLIIGSYGRGRATIVGSVSGIVIADTDGIVIRGLVITGRSATQAGGAGIDVFSDRRGHRRFSHIAISGASVGGFTYGIAIGAAGLAGFRDVRVSDSQLYGNLDAGLASFGPPFNPAAPAYAHAGIAISHVLAFRNLGDPRQTQNSSGSGIVLGSVDGARVTWSAAFANGGSGGGRRRGPEGIWAYDATHVDLAHNLAYANRSANRHDGGGFGLDQNTSRSYLQYNLSYDNWGPGYLLFSPRHNTAFARNVVRFNISSADARTRSRSGGIVLTGWITHSAVYQNSVVLGRWSGAVHAPVLIGRAVRAITVRNSLLVTTHRGPLVAAIAAVRRSQALLQGNDYYSAVRAWSVRWGAARYVSLRALRAATGQELLLGAGRRPVGLAVNPKLAGPVLNLTIRHAGQPGIGAGFTPRRGSPIIGAGLDLLRLFGTNEGPVDFSGHRVPPGRPSVGAQQR